MHGLCTVQASLHTMHSARLTLPPFTHSTAISGLSIAPSHARARHCLLVVFLSSPPHPHPHPHPHPQRHSHPHPHPHHSHPHPHPHHRARWERSSSLSYEWTPRSGQGLAMSSNTMLLSLLARVRPNTQHTTHSHTLSHSHTLLRTAGTAYNTHIAVTAHVIRHCTVSQHSHSIHTYPLSTITPSTHMHSAQSLFRFTTVHTSHSQ
jgi:hypothetical protein